MIRPPKKQASTFQHVFAIVCEAAPAMLLAYNGDILRKKSLFLPLAKNQERAPVPNKNVVD
jgi:hypothetical protein